jgi:hypothetical protein
MGVLLGFPIGDVAFIILLEVTYRTGEGGVKIHINKPLFLDDFI